MNKKCIVVIFGGCSTEHAISIISAKNIIACLDQNKYQLALIYITFEGAWFYISDPNDLNDCAPQALVQHGKAEPVFCLLGSSAFLTLSGKRYPVDCIFPMVHGTHGEDGTLQGLLQLMKVAYVGSNTLSSAITMDKAITKELLQANQIPTTPWRLIRSLKELTLSWYTSLVKEWGEECFVKPANLGSSVGISKVTTFDALYSAVQLAFCYDSSVLVEKCIRGREIECAVLGNDDPKASLPSEIVSHHEFYDYSAKYLDPQGATTIVPADLSEGIVKKIQDLSIRVFHVLRSAGMLRVDFFLSTHNELMVNEANSIPGFTSISMYPAMWEASGISYPCLLDQLIDLALKKHQDNNKIKYSYTPDKNKMPVDSKL